MSELTKPKVKRSLISQDFKEFAIVGLVMTLILLPVRLLFLQFVSSSTLGSFGVISAISILLVVLVKKQKLGKFGQMFERQMFRLTRGKKRIIALSMIGMSLMAFGFMLYAIELGNTTYFAEKESIKVQVFSHFNLKFDSIDDVGSVAETINPDAVIDGMPAFGKAIFDDFKVIAITEALVNDMSNGFIQHFSLVIFVEQVELLGVFVFYAITLRGRSEKQIKEKVIRVESHEPKIKKNRFRTKLFLVCLVGFTVALQVGSLIPVDPVEAKAFISGLEAQIKGIDSVGIFIHNTSIALLMFVPFGGALWGIVTASQTGLAYSALITVQPSMSIMPAVGLLFLSPFGIMELVAYSIAMSRSLIVGHRLLKRQFTRLEAKHLVIDIGILIGLLLAGAFIEHILIQWATNSGFDLMEMLK